MRAVAVAVAVAVGVALLGLLGGPAAGGASSPGVSVAWKLRGVQGRTLTLSFPLSCPYRDPRVLAIQGRARVRLGVVLSRRTPPPRVCPHLVALACLRVSLAAALGHRRLEPLPLGPARAGPPARVLRAAACSVRASG